MNAIFALALLASSSWAGVVTPVESGAVPAGPSIGGLPALTPSIGGALVQPAPGGGGLVGSLPVLPSPVPGLMPAALRFVGESDASAFRPEAAAAKAEPARPAPVARPARAADATPALPGKTSGGTSRPAVALDRKAAGETVLSGPSRATAETAAIEHARPEDASSVGRGFFDQSGEKRPGSLAEREPRRERPAQAGPSAGALPPAGESPLSARASVASASRGALAGAAGAVALTAPGRASAPGSLTVDAREETLRDAVASMPGAASAGAAVRFGASAPNGELAASAAAPMLPGPGAPRPLALDLSGAGLIVRVRAALGVAAAPARIAAAERPLAVGPSTALLERGAMLEAFSVAGFAAARSADPAASALQAAYEAARTPRKSVPVPETSQAPLWWAWFFLPLFVAAARGVL